MTHPQELDLSEVASLEELNGCLDNFLRQSPDEIGRVYRELTSRILPQDQSIPPVLFYILFDGDSNQSLGVLLKKVPSLKKDLLLIIDSVRGFLIILMSMPDRVGSFLSNLKLN